MTKGELTRINIIEVAMKLFYDKGLSEVTFSQISAESGLTQPALYKYFDNKIVLLSQCCLFAAENGRKNIQAQLNPMELPLIQISTYISANLEWFSRSRPEAYALLSMYYFAKSSDEMKSIKHQIESAGVNNITVLIRQSYGEKKFDLENVQNAARMIHSMMVGEIFKLFYNDPSMALKKRIEILDNQVLKIIKSI
jgi:AcrR family transcriptional regulator